MQLNVLWAGTFVKVWLMTSGEKLASRRTKTQHNYNSNNNNNNNNYYYYYYYY